ncbi:P-selectin-like isoform X2 [Branchiostoma floridae x Branchiostoma belcheri]
MRSLVWIVVILILVHLSNIEGKCPKKYKKRGCRPLVIRNTIRSGCSRPFKCGDQCRYTCVPGCVRQRGATVRTCRHGRYWIGGKRLKCSCRPCSGPPVIRNADVIWGSGCSAPFTAGTTCSYQCDHGYRKVGGAETKMCVDGGWTGSSLDCDAVQCPTLTAPEVGSLTPPGPHSYPNLVTFTCETGYVLTGDSDTTCQANGTWSNPVPTCTPVQCPTLTPPANGALSPFRATSYQTVVTFTCNSGYTLNGVATATCQADGTWSHPVPTCTPVQCPTLTPPANGVLRPIGATFYQTVVRFVCYAGYALNGAATTICRADGTWSHPVPVCIPIATIQCPTLVAPANGALTPIGANSYRTVVTFTCNSGYVLNGVTSATCQADGTWSGPVPTCTPVQCPARTAPANGAVTPTGPVSYPNGVTFTCNSIYTLNGVATPTCQADGTWSHPVPTCTLVQCPARAAPANGAVSPAGAVSYPNGVTFTCNSGYALNGIPYPTCLADGTWSHPVPACTRKMRLILWKAEISCKTLVTRTYDRRYHDMTILPFQFDNVRRLRY